MESGAGGTRSDVWRMIAVAALIVGAALLVSSWLSFNQFGLSRGLYPGASRAEVTFWYSVPAFEAGLMIGLLSMAPWRDLDRLLGRLNLLIWLPCGVNYVITFALVLTRAFI
jgi:hypothetical protein